MAHITLEEQFEHLRAQIEIGIELPAVAVVSSACRGDGKTATAIGLARSFSNAGIRTLLLDASAALDLTTPSRRAASLDQVADSGPAAFTEQHADGVFDFISLSTQSLRRAASSISVSRALAACREEYDLILVDAALLLESSLGLLMAQNANTVILTVREGRGVKRADKDLMRVLVRERISVLGVVVISRSAISASEKLHATNVITNFSGRAPSSEPNGARIQSVGG